MINVRGRLHQLAPRVARYNWSFMKPTDQEKWTAALAFALAAHADQTRKGKPSVPYSTHLVTVSALALEHGGGDVELAIAGLLHDTVEDTPVGLDELRERFGPRVAKIVEGLTDLLPGDTPEEKGEWQERKEAYLAALPGKDRETRLVAACDKLHNLRSLVSDLDAEGVTTLERFSARPPQTRWYYQEVRRALGERVPAALGAELDALLERLAEYVASASAE
jgi:(p)ppGpp synthase/HD superfamily hydrolase